MDLKRRDFCKKAATLFAGGVLGGGAAGCSTLGLERLSQQRLSDWLHAFRRRPVTCVNTRFALQSNNEQDHKRLELVREISGQLFRLQSLQELSSSEQRHPKVQKALKDALPELVHTSFRVLSFIEDLSKEERSAIQKNLTNSASWTGAMADFRQYGVRTGVRSDTFQSVELDVLKEIQVMSKKQNLSRFLDKVSLDVDKMYAKVGIMPSERRQWAKMATKTSSGQSGKASFSTAGTTASAHYKLGKKVELAAAIVTGIGGFLSYLALASWIVVIIGGGVSTGFLIFAAVSASILIIGLVLLLISFGIKSAALSQKLP